jgi:Zc3h12a-like Ribonuclease NYN domain
MDWPATFDQSGLPVAVMSLPVEWLVLSLALAGLILFLLARVARGLRAALVPSGPTILVDGSNVMHWDSETPSLEPLRALLAELQGRGQTPGVVFDANAGYKIGTRYMHDGELARLLGLPERQVMVVPKGRQADEYLLQAAREMGAKVVTNDRYRDWEDRFPEVRQPDFLVRGGYRGGAIWLNERTRP